MTLARVRHRLVAVHGVLLTMALLTGCNELLGFGGFVVSDDVDATLRDGGHDGGASSIDAGVDAGCLRDWFRDEDEDGYGDPDRMMTACEAPPGHVDNGDDCDDADDTVRPSADEVCDAIDDDCDGTIDEGLFGPVGAPISIAMDLGDGFSLGEAAVVTTQGGHAVAYRRYDTDELFATFLDLDGNVLAADVFVNAKAGPITATRYTASGLDTIVIAWREFSRIGYRLFNPDGTLGTDNTALDIAVADVVTDLTVQQHGERLLFTWLDDADDLHAVSVLRGVPAASDSVFPRGGGLAQSIGATIASEPPVALLFRTTAPAPVPPDGGLPDGGFADGGLPPGIELVPAMVEIVPLVGASLSPEPGYAWDITGRCDALGGPACQPVVRAYGDNVAPGAPGLMLFEGLSRFGAPGSLEEVSCLFPASADASGVVTPSACVAPPGTVSSAGLFSLAARGGVGTLVVPTGVGVTLGVLEVPLTDAVDGDPTIAAIGSFNTLFMTSPLSVLGAHGAVLGDSPARSATDLIVQRLGCTP